MVDNGSSWGEDGWAVQPDEGEIVDLGGPHRPEILVCGADVQHMLGAFIFYYDVITENPPHAHHDWMKIAYVLDGIYHFQVGDAEFSGDAGTTVVVPGGSYHTFVTATGGRLLFVSAPAASTEQMAEVDRRFTTTALPGDNGRPWRQLRR